jgi:hypothetical protein
MSWRIEPHRMATKLIPKTNSGDVKKENSRHRARRIDLFHWIYAAGATIATGITNFIFLYPQNHLIAFLMLAVWIGLVAAYELSSRSLSPHTIPFIAALFCIAMIAYAVVGPNLPDETPIHGYLIPDHEETPKNSCATGDNDVSLILGTSIFATNATARFPVFQLGGRCVPLWLHRTDNGMIVDFDMYADNTNLISRIINNEWHLVSSELSYVDHPDRSTLQVFDKHGNELFYIKYLNPKTIVLRGSFSCGRERPIVVNSETVSTDGGNFIVGTFIDVRNTGPIGPRMIFARACFITHIPPQTTGSTSH